MAEQHEKALVPQIRFTGFTDPWEQRKLGELFEEHSEKDRDDLPALTIIQGGGTVHRDESNRNLQFDRNSLSNYKVVDTGDFIVHLRSFEGGLEKATCCGLVSPAYHIFRGKNVDSDFYYLYFRSKRFIDADLKPHVYGIRDGRSIDIEGMKTIFIPWTNLAEQRRIGAFFDRLDSLITLHQRKYDKLCVLKKSMLDKMFPKGGSLYPEIRFAGFTDPWEQRKLGQHLKLSRELGHTGVDARKLTVKLWGKGVVEKTDLYGGSAQTQYYIRHAGQFMYGKLDFLHAAFGVVPDKLDCFESTLDSPAFDIEGLDSSFLLNLVTQEDFYLKNGNIANGSRKAKRIHEETFLNMEIRAPELVEQRRIGAFLDRLDSLITLHQRKLELLRNIKKSMLDEMFV
ncbi:restriction endonuclease subunit S [Bifidobacterium adolescentis]|nr:restriction endonuclease subunit S [Bifidobacterium adolescentis]KAB5648135.1 restriction endonuclease subunit S [Bifidobacterium adolescentis]KAB5664816.1 restriction endonuclease subunit S [Bifidobacterium adolescentis]KAB5674065.1 restriction endonuclease subunit S [Bifidobacterium adolescentis]KAB5689378.1 restriction endonuclease subunit S [Bifidobacterium adolescentis]